MPELVLLKETSMSNIPNSAIPHAWAHDDREDAEADDTTTASSPPRALLLAIGAGLAYLAYRVLR